MPQHTCISHSLLRQLKVYSVEDYHVIHSMSYPAPVLSMTMSVSKPLSPLSSIQWPYYFSPRTRTCTRTCTHTHTHTHAHTHTHTHKPTDSHLVVGMSNRLLSIKCRPVKSSTSLPLSEALCRPRPGTYRYFVRGKNYHPGSVRVCAHARTCVHMCEFRIKHHYYLHRMNISWLCQRKCSLQSMRSSYESFNTKRLSVAF